MAEDTKKSRHSENTDDSIEQPDTFVETTEDTSLPKPAFKEQVDPTRYGDWEKNGRCIDF